MTLLYSVLYGLGISKGEGDQVHVDQVQGVVSDLISKVAKGERLTWRHDDDPDHPVYIEVTRVARDGTWADIRCHTFADSWSKRQPLPLPQGVRRRRWSRDDLDRDLQRAIDALGGES